MSNESFGLRLRRERERRKIAIESIAENTKISASLFEDLERDDVSRWPSAIFRRSFIRAYAQAIGLNADETAREFLERFPDRHDPSAAPIAAALAPEAAAARPDDTPRQAAGAPAALKLTVSGTARAFARGPVLRSAGDRLMAVGYDAAIILSLALITYTVLGTLWMPLCLAGFAYYAGSVLILGNTPGVCLCAAPGAAEGEASTKSSLAHMLRVSRCVLTSLRSGRSSSGAQRT